MRVTVSSPSQDQSVDLAFQSKGVARDCVLNGLYEATATLVKDGVDDGIRTRDNQIHNLGL